MNPTGWVVLGALLVGVGAMLTYRWSDGMAPWRRRVLFVLGTLIAGLGGFIATYGWNERAMVSQRHHFAIALASETQANLVILSDRAFRPNPAELHESVVFHQLLDAALSGAIGSALFASPREQPVLTQAIRLRHLISAFNRRLNYAERAMVSAPAHTTAFQTRASRRTSTSDGKRASEFLDASKDPLWARRYSDAPPWVKVADP